jgi:putative cell wall-binding protein
MWQVQWMLGLIPEWVWTTLLVGSIVGLLSAWLLKRIPFVSQYRFPIQIASIASLLVSIWFISANSTNAVWEAKIKDLEDKVKQAEEAANTKNVEIQEKIVTKTKVIKEKGKTQIEYVDRVVTQDKEVIKYVEQCPVPKAIIDAHNAAAEMNKAAEGPKK